MDSDFSIMGMGCLGGKYSLLWMDFLKVRIFEMKFEG